MNTSVNFSETSHAIFFQESRKDVVYHPTIESNKDVIKVYSTKETKKFKRESPKPPKSNRNENTEIDENNKLTLKIPRLRQSNREIKDQSLHKSQNSIRSEIINPEINKNIILEHRRNSAIDKKITLEKYNTNYKYNSNVINSRKMRKKGIKGGVKCAKSLQKSKCLKEKKICAKSLEDGKICATGRIQHPGNENAWTTYAEKYA